MTMVKPSGATLDS